MQLEYTWFMQNVLYKWSTKYALYRLVRLSSGKIRVRRKFKELSGWETIYASEKPSEGYENVYIEAMIQMVDAL